MTEFEENIRNDDRQLALSIEELKGVPDDYLAIHPVNKTDGKVHVFGKSADLAPILAYCQIQSTRERAKRLAMTMGSPENEAVLKRLLDLRRQKANLLGYTDWSHYQLESTMVKSPVAVVDFLDNVFEAVKPRAEREKAQIAKLLKEQEQIVFKPWDLDYGVSRLKSHLFPGFDAKNARQYFPLARAFLALQKIVQDLFRIRFEPIEKVNAWHSSVSACLVYDTSSGQDTLIGRLFFDIYSREGKVDGASTWVVQPPVTDQQFAEVILVANMEGQSGSCMSFLELETLLHELGHCVHGLLSKQRYARLAWVHAVQMDFLEVPSQMLELWLTDETLFDFAVNKNGHRIPDKLLDQLLTAAKTGRAISKCGQIVVSKLAVSFASVSLTR